MKRNILLLITILMAIPIVANTGATAENLSSGAPWIDSELEGAATENMTFDLKDDYAAAMNKDWVLTAEYAQGLPCAGTIIDVNLHVKEQIDQLITGENTDNDPFLAQVQSLYVLYMDWEARNEEGITPLMLF